MVSYDKMLARVKRLCPNKSAEEQDELAREWCEEAAREAEENPPEDTPSIENCDDWGTGEGKFHGRI